MGVNNADVYNNMALCCFYSHNFDSAFACFDRALGMASDEEMANIWYNIGCVYTVRGSNVLHHVLLHPFAQSPLSHALWQHTHMC